MLKLKYYIAVSCTVAAYGCGGDKGQNQGSQQSGSNVQLEERLQEVEKKLKDKPAHSGDEMPYEVDFSSNERFTEMKHKVDQMEEKYNALNSNYETLNSTLLQDRPSMPNNSEERSSFDGVKQEDLNQFKETLKNDFDKKIKEGLTKEKLEGILGDNTTNKIERLEKDLRETQEKAERLNAQLSELEKKQNKTLTEEQLKGILQSNPGSGSSRVEDAVKIVGVESSLKVVEKGLEEVRAELNNTKKNQEIQTKLTQIDNRNDELFKQIQQNIEELEKVQKGIADLIKENAKEKSSLTFELQNSMKVQKDELSKRIEELDGKLMKEKEITVALKKIEDPYNLGDNDSIFEVWANKEMRHLNLYEYIKKYDMLNAICKDSYSYLIQKKTYEELVWEANGIKYESFKSVLENLLLNKSYYFKTEKTLQNFTSANNRKKTITKLLINFFTNEKLGANFSEYDKIHFTNSIVNAIKQSKGFKEYSINDKISEKHFINDDKLKAEVSNTIREICNDSSFLQESDENVAQK